MRLGDLHGDFVEVKRMIPAWIIIVLGVFFLVLSPFLKSHLQKGIWKKLSTRAKVLVYLSLALGTFLTPYGFYVLTIENRPLNPLTGHLAQPEIDFQKPFVVNLGSNLLTQDINSLSQGINLRRFIDFGCDYPIQIKFKDGKLLVSALIMNQKGETVAMITDNQWTVSNDRRIASDRNYNDYAFEVINGDSQPVIQIIVQSGNKIFIGGLFYTPCGRVMANANGLFINPSDSQVQNNIQRIFKYPSDQYLGQMV